MATSNPTIERVLEGMQAVTAAVDAGEPAVDDRLRLFDVHERRLFRLARRLSSSHDEAADLVQETFVRAIRSRALLPEAESEQASWLVTTLVNLARDRSRRQAVRTRAAPILRPSASSDPEATYIARMTVQDALARLDARRRAIVVLHELEGEPIGQIAALLGIRTVTVRWHLAKARRELARILRHGDME